MSIIAAPGRVLALILALASEMVLASTTESTPKPRSIVLTKSMAWMLSSTTMKLMRASEMDICGGFPRSGLFAPVFANVVHRADFQQDSARRQLPIGP